MYNARCDWPILVAEYSRNAHGHYQVNAQLVKRKYRKCESTFDSNSWNDLKPNEKSQFLCKRLLFLVRYKSFVRNETC